MIYVWFIVVLVQSFFLAGQEEQFLKANQLYTQGNYQDAALLYEKINDKGSAVWHNLGHCYWYLQRYKDAFVAYKRALKNVFFQERAMLDAQLIKSLLQWTGKKEVSFALGTRGLSLSMLFTRLQWQLLFLLLLGIFFFCIRGWNHRLLYKVCACILFCMLGLTSWAMYNAWKQAQSHGVVVHQTKLFVAPRVDVHWVKNLSEGEDVIIIDTQEKWSKIDAQGVIGWVVRSDCEAI